MASSSQLPPARHVEYKKGGWGAAILTVVGTTAVFLTAWFIHAQTYRKPTDVMMQTFPRTEAHAAGDHGNAAPSGEHGGTGAEQHGGAAGNDHGAVGSSPAGTKGAAPAAPAGH